MTVVVASRDRRDELTATLGRHRAPVVLVDNGSTDGTPEAVRTAHPDVDVVRLGRNLAAAARTIGVRRARTPYVAFADDDSWWAPGSLHAAAEVLAARPEVGAVTATTLVGPAGDRDPFSETLAASPLRGRHGDLPGPRVIGFMACATMVRRTDFLAVGGFDDVVRFPGEEERLAWDLTAAGADLVLAPAVVVHHHPSPRRSAPAARRRGVARSRLLTGVMRLPWSTVAARTATDILSGAPERRGLWDARSDLAAALRGRRLLPADVLADIRAVADAGRRRHSPRE